ncbi:MAG: alpha-L-arabinofuranosidase [Chitinophaga sp.]|jgi:alpha-L-arabinofuranosidase|nr:alpha-L-arabinofuranosidase [Chitinophaga sp.]
MKKIILYLSAFLFCLTNVVAQNKIIVEASKIIAPVQPTMWGIFFEDINFAADGGIYAELVKNRSFEFTTPLMGWKEIKQNGGNGKLLVINDAQLKPQNPRYLRISSDTINGEYGLSNEGFRGMGIQKNEQYNFSVWVRKKEGNAKIIVELIGTNGKKLGTASLQNFTNDWKKYKVSFTSNDTCSKAKLNVLLQGKGTIDVDMISLFPQHTWKERPEGLRADLVQWLADLKPGFIRFPGGCIVEGRDLANRYQWKKTVGTIENRELIINRWNTEFKNKLTPDYFQSYGLGFYEYFLLAEDIGAEPLPILNCGMACQFNSAEVAAIENEKEFIQDALDLIEFANGSITTKWGKLRAAMGHPKPFNLKMMGVGNENWGAQYIERNIAFTKAIKAKYPNIQLVNSSGTDPDGERFNFLNDTLRKLGADLIDEHYYRAPEWFLQNVKHYDNYDRKGSKVFAGEYAAHSKLTNDGEKKNNWESALAEAAFMTGLERNAGVVYMASYAPLFAHIDAWQWAPDLIWFNSLQSYATPNYYVQQMYSTNKGTHVISMLHDGETIAGKNNVYGNAVIDKNKKEVIIKLANVNATSINYTIELNGLKKINNKAVMQLLTSNNIADVNNFIQPQNIKPVEQTIAINNNELIISLPPSSFSVIKIPVEIK